MQIDSHPHLAHRKPTDVLEISYRGPEIAYTNSGLFLFYAYQQLVIRENRRTIVRRLFRGVLQPPLGVGRQLA